MTVVRLGQIGTDVDEPRSARDSVMTDDSIALVHGSGPAAPLRVGDIVVFLWGISEVMATVKELYGPDERRQVILTLAPEMSGYVVAEPTTLSLPAADVRRPAVMS